MLHKTANFQLLSKVDRQLLSCRASAPMVVSRLVPATELKLDIIDLLLEKPDGINEISIKMHQLISKTPGQPVRLIFDSLSTLGTMFNPQLLAPWLLDQRSKLLKHSANVLALVIYATGINPPSITRSLHTFSDVVLEMKIDESKEEPERQFRILKARDVSHSTRWIPFRITDSGISFVD